MTLYIPAYDVENEKCLDALRKIVPVHEKHGLRATLFICARLIERQRDGYLSLLKGHPLFEIACHSYSHMMLADAPPINAKAGPLDRFPKEIVESKHILEDAFGCRVLGFRPPVSTVDGMKGCADALRLFHEAGYAYLSSHLWGPEWSMPALLTRPYTYEADGYPVLWELPACGWHENLLKHGYAGKALRLLLFPSPMPESAPLQLVKTPEEEFAVNCRPFIDKAAREDFPEVSLVWHPWSLDRFDPSMRMLDMTFSYVKELGIEAGTYAEFLERVKAAAS